MYLQPGACAIDVGAHIGDLTLPMARIVGTEGRVYAYESNPEIFNILCANLAINQIKNVKPVNAFVADSPEVETSSPVWGKHAFTGDVWETTFAPLDNLKLKRLDFIKIDTDGNELSVMSSGAKIIQQFQPVIYYENDIRDKSAEIIQFLLNFGYRIFFHPAPIFQENNFYQNRKNFWAPKNIVSLMMLAIPNGKPVPNGLREVTDKNDWWDGVVTDKPKK